jgi:hypothetical protein
MRGLNSSHVETVIRKAERLTAKGLPVYRRIQERLQAEFGVSPPSEEPEFVPPD